MFPNPYDHPDPELDAFAKANWKERFRQLFIGAVVIIAVGGAAMLAWEYGYVPKL